MLQRDIETLWLSVSVCNFEEMNVQPAIDFGKGSYQDDEEVCPVKWLLCEISCRRLISAHSIFIASSSQK